MKNLSKRETSKQRSSSSNSQGKQANQLLENTHEMAIIEQVDNSQKESRQSFNQGMDSRRQFSHIKSSFAEKMNEILSKAQQYEQDKNYQNATKQSEQSINQLQQSKPLSQKNKNSNQEQKVKEYQTNQSDPRKDYSQANEKEMKSIKERKIVSPMEQFQQIDQIHQGPQFCLRSHEQTYLNHIEDLNSNDRLFDISSIQGQQDLSHVKLTNPNSIFNNFEFFCDFISGRIDNQAMLQKITEDLGENVIQEVMEKQYVDLEENQEIFNFSANELFNAFNQNSSNRPSSQQQDLINFSMEGQQEIPHDPKVDSQQEEESENSKGISFNQLKDIKQTFGKESEDEIKYSKTTNSKSSRYSNKSSQNKESEDQGVPQDFQQYRNDEKYNLLLKNIDKEYKIQTSKNKLKNQKSIQKKSENQTAKVKNEEYFYNEKDLKTIQMNKG